MVEMILSTDSRFTPAAHLVATKQNAGKQADTSSFTVRAEAGRKNRLHHHFTFAQAVRRIQPEVRG